MLRRLPGVRLRLARLTARGSRVRRDQAHRRRTQALPRVVLLLPVVLSAGLVLALRPGDITRATKPWTWTPLPSTAFGSLPSPDGDAARPATPVGGRGAAVMVGGDGLDAPPATALVQAAPTPVPTPEGPTHVVASGDDLWTIARRHSADLASILRWNDGVDPDRLMAGQRILVPGGSKMKPLPKPAVVTPRVASVRPATTDRPASPYG